MSYTYIVLTSFSISTLNAYRSIKIGKYKGTLEHLHKHIYIHCNYDCDAVSVSLRVRETDQRTKLTLGGMFCKRWRLHSHRLRLLWQRQVNFSLVESWINCIKSSLSNLKAQIYPKPLYKYIEISRLYSTYTIHMYPHIPRSKNANLFINVYNCINNVRALYIYIKQ